MRSSPRTYNVFDAKKARVALQLSVAAIGELNDDGRMYWPLDGRKPDRISRRTRRK